MKHAAKQILMVCLLCLPAAAFADVYPLAPPPDLFISYIDYTGTSLTGVVEAITDVGSCGGFPCGADLDFSQLTPNAFQITDGGSNVYLAGSLVPGSAISEAGGEFGELFDVTVDNEALWSALESVDSGTPVTASSFGSEVVLDLHDFYGTTGLLPDATGDMTPAATPEPASLTLLFTGLVAGFARKRMARKRSNQILA
jgi:hypothetical protein